MASPPHAALFDGTTSIVCVLAARYYLVCVSVCVVLPDIQQINSDADTADELGTSTYSS